jgi:hypothetical protein
VRIFDIEFYRDGGSIEFQIEKNGVTRHVRLETPWAGEPRALLVDSTPVNRGSAQVQELLSDLATWWELLPSDTRALVEEVRARTGPYYNPSAEIIAAANLSHVARVRDYVQAIYGA